MYFQYSSFKVHQYRLDHWRDFLRLNYHVYFIQFPTIFGINWKLFPNDKRGHNSSKLKTFQWVHIIPGKLLFDLWVRTEAQMCPCDPHALFVAQVCEIIQINCPHNMAISSSNIIRETINNKTEFRRGSFFLQITLFFCFYFILLRKNVT